MNHTPTENTLVKPTLFPQDIADDTPVEGTGVNCLGYESALVEIEVGAIAEPGEGEAISLTAKLQESSDDADDDPYADVTLATTGTLLTAGENSTHLFDVNLSERKQYLRVVAVGAADGGGLLSASIHLSRGRHLPVTQDSTVVVL